MKKIQLIIMLLCCGMCFSQAKQEYEKRIEVDDFPKAALEILKSSLDKARRVRFYEEFDDDKRSFECKFKYNGAWFSAEFDPSGILEDIEVLIRRKDIDPTVRKQIEQYLSNTYERWKIEKIQRQYLGNTDKSTPIFKAALNRKSLSSNNFELIVATKDKGKLKMYEILFDNQGSFIKKRNVERRSYDFLLF